MNTNIQTANKADALKQLAAIKEQNPTYTGTVYNGIRMIMVHDASHNIVYTIVWPSNLK